VVLHDYALYKSTFTLLYYTYFNSNVSRILHCRRDFATKRSEICIFTHPSLV